MPSLVSLTLTPHLIAEVGRLHASQILIKIADRAAVISTFLYAAERPAGFLKTTRWYPRYVTSSSLIE